MAQLREMLAGRYELRDLLGRGGMGVVYRATDVVLERTVAIKVLPADRAQDPTWVKRFEREARSAAALSHRSIVSVFDTGQADGTRYIVMEYVPGASLAQLLRDHAPLPVAQAVGIAAAVAGALAAAHRSGIIHRDIKPSNVMVEPGGNVKVLDFGIARALHSSSLTQTAMVLGSARYMAPEVALGGSADGRSDIYSLGCVLYEMLTGAAPFDAEVTAAIVHQQVNSRPRPPVELNPDIPVALDRLVMRTLSKSPGDRPQPAERLARLLTASDGDRLRPASRAASVGHAEPTATTRVLAPGQPTATTRGLGPAWSANKGWAIVLGAATLLALIGLLLLLSSGSSGRRTSSNPPVRGHKSTAHRARHKSASAVSSSTTTAQSSPAPPSVPVAAGQLTTLATQDLQSGAIDQQASQQILGHLQDILNSAASGNPSDALHKVADLTNQISQLAAHGDIKPSALLAINAAVSALSTALTRTAGSAATSTAPPPPGPGGGSPPGQGGGPPPGHGRHDHH